MSAARVADVPTLWDVERHREYDDEHGGPVFLVRRRRAGGGGAFTVVTLAILPSGVRHLFTDNGRGLPLVLSAHLWGMVDAEGVTA